MAQLFQRNSSRKHGNNIWWTENDEAYLFNDSKNDNEYHSNGPERKLPDIEQTARKAWDEIIDQKTILPTPSIR